MTKKMLYSLWGVLFIICSALGFIPQPSQNLRPVLTVLSVVFFLPPAILLCRAHRDRDRYTAGIIRNFSLVSLALTLGLLVLNLVCAMGSEFLGNALHAMLVILSCPMVCSGYWVLSLFLWACLLMASLKSAK